MRAIFLHFVSFNSLLIVRLGTSLKHQTSVRMGICFCSTPLFPWNKPLHRSHYPPIHHCRSEHSTHVSVQAHRALYRSSVIFCNCYCAHSLNNSLCLAVMIRCLKRPPFYLYYLPGSKPTPIIYNEKSYIKGWDVYTDGKKIPKS